MGLPLQYGNLMRSYESPLQGGNGPAYVPFMNYLLPKEFLFDKFYVSNTMRLEGSMQRTELSTGKLPFEFGIASGHGKDVGGTSDQQSIDQDMSKKTKTHSIVKAILITLAPIVAGILLGALFACVFSGPVIPCIVIGLCCGMLTSLILSAVMVPARKCGDKGGNSQESELDDLNDGPVGDSSRHVHLESKVDKQSDSENRTIDEILDAIKAGSNHGANSNVSKDLESRLNEIKEQNNDQVEALRDLLTTSGKNLNKAKEKLENDNAPTIKDGEIGQNWKSELIQKLDELIININNCDETNLNEMKELFIQISNLEKNNPYIMAEAECRVIKKDIYKKIKGDDYSKGSKIAKDIKSNLRKANGIDELKEYLKNALTPINDFTQALTNIEDIIKSQNIKEKQNVVSTHESKIATLLKRCNELNRRSQAGNSESLNELKELFLDAYDLEKNIHKLLNKVEKEIQA
ncbi:MAG: hypothetical protein LBI69_01220 [Puniceicoccales bacterium]|jgi:protein-arginine kinase activator protein McsA|nr:hypothetical protein [Puniceicoccales bacterium]